MKKVIICIVILLISVVGCENKETSTDQDNYEVILLLKRESSFGGLFLDYSVYIDGQKIGQISNADTEKYQINLSKGEHTIYVKYGISSKKLKFYVDENNTYFTFNCKTKSTFGIDIWEDYSS